ncbi:phosphate ABC transporter permease subunit PstC [Desulfotomaculum sp. 1211_IL3151]|uniref:phosphate ABC transporter permease subunit PstC n=1 Tax=Desulfotomaculum sp. 1211_IL3151 TaxID=3084055 RepID=UPI002FDA2471
MGKTVETVVVLTKGIKPKKQRYQLGRRISFLCALLVIVLTLSIVVFITSKGLSTFLINNVSLKEFLFSTEWFPDRTLEEGGPRVGALTFIFGSVAVSMLAVLISAPLSFITAIFMVEIAPGWGQRLLQPCIELLSGIPSVVYGYIGLSVLVPFIREYLGGLGFSLLAGVMVLSVMIIPTIVSVSVDSLRSLPSHLKEAAYALGSTRWQTIRLILIPAAKTGLFTGVILGLARAFGEALAVQMVIGNTKQIPQSLLDQLTTLTSGITMDMGYTVVGSLWNNTLWSMATILLLMSFFFILLIRIIAKRGANC